jgi:cytoskeletal protein CcmA (bactofilin family)
MFGKQRQPDIGVIDNGTELVGDLKFSDLLKFYGRIKGRVFSEGVLVVGESGFIEGDVEVGMLSLSGTLIGNIMATQKVHFLQTARVQGDVCTPVLKVDEGASWDGTISMSRLKPIGQVRVESEKEEEVFEEGEV